MKGAAQSAMFEPAEGQIRSAMRAVTFDQAVASLCVAKENKVFAEQLHRPYGTWSFELIEQRRRLPVHPHQLAAGVLRAGACDQVVLFLAHHGASPHPKKACDGRRSKRIVRLLNKCSIIVNTTLELGKGLSWSSRSVPTGDPTASPAPPISSKASTAVCGCCRSSANARHRWR